MRKTEENPEYYDVDENDGLGCAMLLVRLLGVAVFTLLLWFFTCCGKVKQGANCEAYHTGNTNHKAGR